MSMNNVYSLPYGAYGELYTRGVWLPSSVESAFSAEVAKDELNLQNELFKIECVLFNPNVSFPKTNEGDYGLSFKQKETEINSSLSPRNSSLFGGDNNDTQVESQRNSDFFQQLLGIFCCR
ncbi:hypothetical protein OQB17_004442 [Salmonella enterica]|nr:hypothetical protein [Salmonella enterica]